MKKYYIHWVNDNRMTSFISACDKHLALELARELCHLGLIVSPGQGSWAKHLFTDFCLFYNSTDEYKVSFDGEDTFTIKEIY